METHTIDVRVTPVVTFPDMYITFQMTSQITAREVVKDVTLTQDVTYGVSI